MTLRADVDAAIERIAAWIGNDSLLTLKDRNATRDWLDSRDIHAVLREIRELRAAVEPLARRVNSLRADLAQHCSAECAVCFGAKDRP